MQKNLLSKLNENRAFLLYLAAIWVFNVVTPLVVLPVRLLLATSVLVSVLAISLPILALFEGAKQTWTFNKGVIFLATGVVIQFGCLVLAQVVFKNSISLILSTLAFSQIGLVLWCLGLGSMVSLLVLDKNLIFPITVFLALIDIFLVLTPIGPTKQIMEAAPQVLHNVGLSVPKPAAVVTTGHVGSLANVGPADLIFIGMFFAALHRFGVNAKRTLGVLTPTLAAYLLVVIFLGGLKLGRFELNALPALVPIGLVVLLANIREFKLTRDEKLSTILVLGIAGALVGWGMTRQPKQVKPEEQQGPPVQTLPESDR